MKIFEIPNESLAIGFFNDKGFEARKIEETNTDKRCDLLLNDGLETYLVEVKKREEDEAVRKKLNTDGLYHHPVKSLGYDPRVQEKIKEAMQQLTRTEILYSSKFKIIWFSIINRFESNYEEYERLLSTIYGIERIFFRGNIARKVGQGCYYFTHSCFYTYKELDAVIIAHSEGCELCVNNYSYKYEHFKSTKLYKSFSDSESARDPGTNNDNYFIADCDIDRNKKNEVLKYLAEKYSLIEPQSFNLDSHTTSFTSPI